MRGGQSRQYYIDVAWAVGFTITITEFEPFRVGSGRAGDYLAGEEWLFYWRVTSWEQNQKIYLLPHRAVGDARAAPLLEQQLARMHHPQHRAGAHHRPLRLPALVGDLG